MTLFVLWQQHVMCLLVFEYAEVDEGENNAKLHVSPPLSEHNLSFCMRGNAGRRYFWQDILQANVWSVDYGMYSVPF